MQRFPGTQEQIVFNKNKIFLIVENFDRVPLLVSIKVFE